MYLKARRNVCYAVILLMCLTPIKSTFLNEECHSEGASCLNCTHRKMCVRWIPFFGPIVRHGEPTPCSDALTGHSLKYCDPASNQCVSYVPDQCHMEGTLSCLREEPGNTYPDVGNCRKYYECSENAPNVQQCPSGTIYKQDWRKCTVNLNNQRDCLQVTECPASSKAYPGDSSLYYRCNQGNTQVSLLACPTSLDVYDPVTDTCQSKGRCETPSQLLPIPYKCSSFYDCSTNTENQCPGAEGFNPILQRCMPLYNNLCNEITLLQTNVRSIIGGFFVYDIIERVFIFINICPYSFINLLPVPQPIITTSILVTDYLLKERSIPPGLISYLLEYGLSLIPPPIRAIIDMLLNLLPFKLPVGINLSRDEAIALAVGQEFAKANFSELVQNLQNIESVQGAFQIFVKHVSTRLDVPQENVYGILQFLAPTLSQTVNRLFGGGTNILVVENRELHLDETGVWQILQGQLQNVENLLKGFNEDLSGIFRSLVKLYDKEEHRFVEKIAEAVYLPLHV